MSLGRCLTSLSDAYLSPEHWAIAAEEEHPVQGRPCGCAKCPLRRGGEWEAGALATLPDVSPETLARLQGWGCHASARPCAGMRRVLKAVANSSSPSTDETEAP